MPGWPGISAESGTNGIHGAVSGKIVAPRRLQSYRGRMQTSRAWRPSLRPWMLVSAAWVVPALFGALDAYAQAGIWGNELDWRAVVFTALDWLLYGFLTPFVFMLARRFPITRERVTRNGMLHVIFSLFFCVLWASAGTLLKVALRAQAMDEAVLREYLSWIFTTFPFGVAVYLAMVGVEHAVRYFIESREREMQVARLSGQLSTARLAALQAQLNPHFLFNSLNTIAVLVRDNDATRATRVIEELSDVLRTTLGRSRASEVSLDDELALVKQYLGVELARFSDRLQPHFDIPPSLLSAAVPSFAMQHLVENALRHGIARRADAGVIGIAARRDGDTLEVTVTDDGAGFGPGDDLKPGHGLDNTRERLATLYGDRASIDVAYTENAGTTARMRIPYREILHDTERDAGS